MYAADLVIEALDVARQTNRLLGQSEQMITTQQALSASFWQDHPELTRQTKKKSKTSIPRNPCGLVRLREEHAPHWRDQRNIGTKGDTVSANYRRCVELGSLVRFAVGGHTKVPV